MIVLHKIQKCESGRCMPWPRVQALMHSMAGCKALIARPALATVEVLQRVGGRNGFKQ